MYDLADAITGQLAPIVAQTLAALIGAAFLALLGLGARTVNAGRNYLTAKNWLVLRGILDDAINNAKKAIPPELINANAEIAAKQIADYLTAYVTKMQAGTLSKLKTTPAEVAERMAKEATSFLTEKAAHEAWQRSKNIINNGNTPISS